MRLFLAINLPADVRRDIVAATAPLRECVPEVAWIDEARLHLTLKFLGEQTQPVADAARDAAVNVAAGHRQLTLHLGGLGAFPNFRRSRVVWMGVEQEPRLELLHHDVEVACQAIGFEVGGRPFRPHLTLARVKHPLPVERARELARTARRVDYHGEVLVESLDLMESRPGSGGSIYTAVVTAPLRSA